MNIEWVDYWPTARGADVQKVKARLPDRLKSGLMSGHSHSDFGIYVDASNEELIAELDRYFRIGKGTKYLKRRCVEVDKKASRHLRFFVK